MGGSLLKIIAGVECLNMESNNKKCQFCGEEIKAEAVKCKHCNEWLDRDDKKALSKKYSGKISTIKFVVLYFATFGVYPLFWMYSQWNLLKIKQSLDVSPFWRSVFGTLWAGSLAGNVKNFLKGNNVMVSYSPGVIGVLYFVLNLLSRLPDQYWLLSFLSFVPLLPIIEAMNEYYEKSDADLPEKSLSWWQGILVGIGLLLLIVIVYYTFYPEA